MLSQTSCLTPPGIPYPIPVYLRYPCENLSQLENNFYSGLNTKSLFNLRINIHMLSSDRFTIDFGSIQTFFLKQNDNMPSP